MTDPRTMLRWGLIFGMLLAGLLVVELATAANC